MHAGCCVSEHRRLIVRYEVYLSHVDQSIRAPRELFQRYVWGCVCEFLQSLSVFFMSLLFLLSWVIYSRLLVRDRSPRPTLLFPNSANALLPLKGIKAKLLHSFENIDTSLSYPCVCNAGARRQLAELSMTSGSVPLKSTSRDMASYSRTAEGALHVNCGNTNVCVISQ